MENKTIISKIHSQISNFMHDEQGDIAVMFAFLFPVLLFMMIYFENTMQARYIYQQTQTVMDIATRGGAMTGNAVQSNGGVFCTIPYNPDDPEFSGDHVARKLFKENISTLPRYVQTELLNKLNTGKIKGLNDPDLRAGGYVEMKVTFNYKPATPLFSQKYRFTVSSTSKCEADV